LVRRRRKGGTNESTPRNAAVRLGGLPILVNGRMIGAIGLSGMSSAQDAQVACAGLDALKP
jgi:uncharacterized protein GlcG (DUF336 family)